MSRNLHITNSTKGVSDLELLMGCRPVAGSDTETILPSEYKQRQQHASCRNASFSFSVSLFGG